MKSWQHTVLICTAAVGITLPWHGCGSDATGRAGGEDSAQTGDAASGEFTLLSSEPVPYSGKGDPTQFELLADSDFARFAAGASPEWATKQIGWRQLSGDPESIQFVETEGRGRTVLSLQPSASATTLQQATADLGPLRENAWLVATMRAKAETPYTLGIAIGYPGRGDQLEIAEGHPGDGQWHDVVLRLPIPTGLSRNQFKCTVVNREVAKTPAMVEAVHLRVEYPDRAAAQTNLALNGDFESYGFTAPPYPWTLDRWNSKGLPISGGDAVIVPAEGSAGGAMAMSFTPPADFTNVRISQPVFAVTQADAGTKLVASGMGLAFHHQDLWIQLRGQRANRDVANQKAFAIHPGDGNWHDIAVEFIVPGPNVADTIYLDVFRRSSSTEQVVIDNIRVERIK